MERIDFVDVEGVERPVVGFAYFRGLLNKKVREVPVVQDADGDEMYWASDEVYRSFDGDLVDLVFEFDCRGPAITD